MGAGDWWLIVVIIAVCFLAVGALYLWDDDRYEDDPSDDPGSGEWW